MKSDANAKMPTAVQPPKSLTKALAQSEHVKNLVEESAEELSSANVILKQGLVVGRDPLPKVEKALAKSQAAEEKVQEASEELSVLNRALESEVKERRELDHQFAAVTELEEASRHAAFHDVLTGLPNRALFNDRLEHGLAQAKRHGWSLAVMFIDLDGFKEINDSHGHDAGDDVLQTVAARLKEHTRGDDTVSRHGGDEFLYLATEIRDEQNIMLIVDKIFKAIREPFTLSVRDIATNTTINASIGISIFPADGGTAEDLIKSADEAMYRAKQTKAGYSFAL